MNVSVVQSVLAELELRERAIEANLTLAETTNSESQTTIDQVSGGGLSRSRSRILPIYICMYHAINMVFHAHNVWSYTRVCR